jgi:transcriptional regulator with XRE-family HTH domain
LKARIQFLGWQDRQINWPCIDLVDLNSKYIGEVERGEKIISIEALLRIARTVKIPIREFFRDIPAP